MATPAFTLYYRAKGTWSAPLHFYTQSQAIGYTVGIAGLEAYNVAQGNMIVARWTYRDA